MKLTKKDILILIICILGVGLLTIISLIIDKDETKSKTLTLEQFQDLPRPVIMYAEGNNLGIDYIIVIDNDNTLYEYSSWNSMFVVAIYNSYNVGDTLLK